MRLTCVVGARPNFPKVAPILAAASARRDVTTKLVHTGQHYDERMSTLFFEELGIPAPDVYLGVGSASHAVQTARVMIAFDEVLDNAPADVVLVVGDVNSTLACALVAVKRGVAVAHVEAGLRSGDRTMPEEINRILTDQVSDLLFTTERSAADNLVREGIPADKIHFVGNVMIDTLFRNRTRAASSDILRRLELQERGYALCTLHRPSNVDTQEDAENTVDAIRRVTSRMSVVLPLHPRTRAKLEQYKLLAGLESMPGVCIIEPLGYLDFLALMDRARMVFTDSGGIQEESTALGVPCLTFRDNTERPITITEGTNRLVGRSPERVAAAIEDVLASNGAHARVPELWDGHAAERILDVLEDRFAAQWSKTGEKAAV
jgi:UDP-N-acetylglucosamine 2-epimerase (non-hydrolysing)